MLGPSEVVLNSVLGSSTGGGPCCFRLATTIRNSDIERRKRSYTGPVMPCNGGSMKFISIYSETRAGDPVLYVSDSLETSSHDRPEVVSSI